MAKYYGKIGYGIMTEIRPGYFGEEIIERPSYGDLVRNVRKWENGEGLNDDLNIQNDISIVADSFAYENFHKIRYATYMGAKWKVRTVEVQHPRLILSLGGVYNDQFTKAFGASEEA